eukprot:gene23361-30621_t
MAQETVPSCENCSAVPSDTLLRCSSCREAYYCGAECQRSHWPNHKAQCKLTRQSRAQELVSSVESRGVDEVVEAVEANPELLRWEGADGVAMRLKYLSAVTVGGNKAKTAVINRLQHWPVFLPPEMCTTLSLSVLAAVMPIIFRLSSQSSGCIEFEQCVAVAQTEGALPADLELPTYPALEQDDVLSSRQRLVLLLARGPPPGGPKAAPPTVHVLTAPWSFCLQGGLLQVVQRMPLLQSMLLAALLPAASSLPLSGGLLEYVDLEDNDMLYFQLTAPWSFCLQGGLLQVVQRMPLLQSMLLAALLPAASSLPFSGGLLEYVDLEDNDMLYFQLTAPWSFCLQGGLLQVVQRMPLLQSMLLAALLPAASSLPFSGGLLEYVDLEDNDVLYFRLTAPWGFCLHGNLLQVVQMIPLLQSVLLAALVPAASSWPF